MVSPTTAGVDLKGAFQLEAAHLGFSVCGVAPVQPELRREYYLKWIAEGRHGDMTWLERNTERRLDPAKILPEARSIICLGLNYYQSEPQRRGRIAKYALGQDYHNFMMKRLKKLCHWLRQRGGQNKPYVDTGPVLEKPVAVLAGLGWQAKNTMLIHPKMGNWLFLGEIFTTLEMPPDERISDHCGECTACISACPTGAITAPYQLDARRCIAYLTIEHKGTIPEKYREAIGDRLFGCDECLDVCPWNRWAQATREEKFAARQYPDLREMLAWNDEDFRSYFRQTPILRLKRVRWLRNICVVLGNIGGPDDLPALEKAAQDPDPLIAEHAHWAINQINKRINPAKNNRRLK